MIRLLVTNGCSHTRGAELADPESQSWPARLGQALGVPVVNMARDGSSNRRIVRTTVARLPGVCAEAAVSPDQILVVIAWTESSRHEYYRPGDRPQPPSHHVAERNWEDIGSWRNDAGHKPSRAFYDHLWSDEGQLTNLFLDWLLLERYLRRNRFQARFSFAHPAPTILPKSSRPFLAQLDGSATLGGLPPCAEMSFLGMIEGRDRGPEGHPLADGHAVFAQRLARWILS